MKTLNFYTLDSSKNRQLQMCVNNDGNLGVGITNPSKKLEVAGDISFNGNLYQNGSLFTSSGGGGGGGGLADLTSSSISDLSDVSLNGIQVNQTLKWDGEKLVPTTLATTAAKQGQVLETLTGRCDGRTVVMDSGSYTLPNITSQQATTTSYASLITFNYTPPSNTKQVIIDYKIFYDDLDDGMNNVGYRLSIANQVFGNAIELDQLAGWSNGIHIKRFIIDVTGTDDIANGKLANWTTSKEIDLEVRTSAGNSPTTFHKRRNLATNSPTDSDVLKPSITITAIGESSGQAVTLTNNSVNDLSDISFNTASTTNGQALVWNSTDGVWEAGTVASGDNEDPTNMVKLGTTQFTITVNGKTSLHPYQNGSANGYFINGNESPILTFVSGKKYRFDQSHSTNSSHPLKFYLEANKTTEYSTNVTLSGTAGQSGSYTEIEITDSTPTNLYYQCGNHSYMGNVLFIEGYSNITDGDLTIAKTSGLQAALDAKQATLTAGTNITINGTTISASGGGGGGGSAIDQTTDVSLNDLTIHGDISGSASSSIKFDGGTQITETSTKLKSWVIDNSGTFDISHVGYQSSGSEGTNWPKPRQEHSTIMDNSNNIIIFGGKDSGSNHLSDIWEYDIDTSTYTKKVTTLQTSGTSSVKPSYSSDNTWLPYENLSTHGIKNERSDNRSMAAYDDKVYYLTDEQLWVKDLTVTVSNPSTAGNSNWSQVTGITGSLPNNSKRGAFFYHNDSGTDYLYYLFGVIADTTGPGSGDFNTSAYRFNISTKTWSSTSATNSTTDYKRMYSAFHVYDGYCFAYGGNVNASNFSNTFVKVGLGGSGDKAFGYCSTLSASPESGSNTIIGRTYSSWAGQGQYMFIIGGRISPGDQASHTQKCIFRYDCANNTYRQITSTSDSIANKLHWEEGMTVIYDNKLIMASSYNAGTSGATNYLLSVDISTTSNSYSLAYYPDGSIQTDASRRINTQANNSVGVSAAWVVYKNRWYFMFPYGTGITSGGGYNDAIVHSNGFGGGISPYMWTYVFADYQDTATYDLVNHTSSLHDNNMYIFGGKNSSNTYANNLLRVALSNYTLSSLTVSSLPSIRDSHSSAPLNDKIYIFGGWDGSTVNNETWELDLSTDPPTSTQKQSNVISSVNINRYGHSAVIYDGNMYIFGGHDGTNLYNTIYKYNITNNSWALLTTNGTSPSVRYYHTAFVTKDEMIVYGGKDAANATIQDSFLFDFNNSTWYNLNDDATTTHTLTSANIRNYSSNAGVIHYNSGDDYKIYLYGGYNSQTTALLGGNGIIQTTDISHNLTEYVTSEVGIAFTFNTDNTGKVGIGKLIPTKTLDVGGDINFSGSLYQNGSVVNIGSSTFNQNTDLTINSLTTVNDISFAGNLYQNGALFTSGGGVSNGDDISFNNMDISGVLGGTSGYSNNQLSLGSHIIPTSNASFDLGSAEYKIRHLFLSDNSLWIGDDHKIDISGGKMKFKKRKKTAIPKNISDLGGNHANINTIINNTAGVTSIEEMTLHHWHDYAIQHSLDIAGKGAGNASIEDIFSSNHPDDWDNDDELDTWTRNGSNINYSSGNVGIGTDSPRCNLHVSKGVSISTISSISDCYLHLGGTEWTNNQLCLMGLGHVTAGSTHNPPAYMGYIATGGTGYSNGALIFGTRNTTGASDLPTERMRVDSAGNVGIGTNDPGYALEIVNSGTGSGSQTGTATIYAGGSYFYSNHSNQMQACLKTSTGIWCGGEIMVTSDRRIKENIVDVPDNLALEMVRNIPCRYYEYKDKWVRGTEKTIGFIAQDVNEILPMAVSITNSIIPNEMRLLSNISWGEIDPSNNYKLTTDLSDCSGIKYRFYVSNDPSGNDECMKEIVGNDDSTFTFDQSWNNVFCYGKEVDDFHTLDKQKIFALNFSATQELDRQQQADKAKIAELETKIASQDTIIQSLISRIETLENN